MHYRFIFECIAACLIGGFSLGAAKADVGTTAPLKLHLRPCRVAQVDTELRCGTYSVFEDRQAKRGRLLPLRVIIIPALSKTAQREPIFIVVGGPGQTATELSDLFANSWQRREHDLVLVDQRGTGEGHRLDCRPHTAVTDMQQYLEPIFVVAEFRKCRAELEARANLTLYTTPIAMADLDEVRQALGYGRINLMGSSYGTRAILTYIRRYGHNVRAAMLSGMVPPSFRNPLYHALSAQQALDGLFAECGADASCGTSFPTLREDFRDILARLRLRPAAVTLKNPISGAPTKLTLSATAFGEGVRVLLYSARSARRLPLLLARAKAGDLVPFATAALQGNRALRDGIRLGLLQSVICNEDIPRIRKTDIATATKGTFLGPERILQQTAACAIWPKARVPMEYWQNVRSAVPVLLISGNLDPATPARFGEETARYLSNSLHLVVPGGHAPNNECVNKIGGDFFLRGAVNGLDVSCIEDIEPLPFDLPS